MYKIKFRGKRIDTGEWAFGNIAWEATRPFIFLNGFQTLDGGYCSMTCWEVDPATIGQFTNIYDEDDNEIYTGDICSGIYGSQRYINQVGFIEGAFVLWHNNDEFGCCATLNEHDYRKLLGNVHDNPEILKA